MKGERVYSLSYADDMVFAEEEDEMKSMLERLENNLDEKGLKLNINKAKMIRCRREGGR